MLRHNFDLSSKVGKRRVLRVDRRTCKNYALALVLCTFKNIVNLFMGTSNRFSRYQINVVVLFSTGLMVD